ncbi:MAG TPA: hypothetical protein VK918_09010 [Pyrinomonadaceae bacterium]|nr:hypothetical protein [Pyrinomonadaceae bacterium]
MKNLITLALVILGAGTISAQTAEFRWEDGLCEYTATYDPKRVTRRTIEDTLQLYQSVGSIPLEYSATVWKYEDIDGLDPAALDREYQEKRKNIADLQLAGPYWEDLRKKKLKELDQYYRLSDATIRGYREPSALGKYEGADECKTRFAEGIIVGGDGLAKTWEAVNIASRAKNSDPARLKRIFDEQNASPDRLKFALVETMSFGWWNCVNDTIDHVGHDEHEEMDREFRKLFIRVKEICDEP